VSGSNWIVDSGDLDGDSNLDLALAGKETPVRVILDVPGHAEGPCIGATLERSVDDLVTGDMDADGKSELVTADATGTRVWSLE
jgi:hypothetical protein